MLQMNKHYEPEFKKKIVHLHLEEGRTIQGLTAEYNVSKASISNWVHQFRKECQINKEAEADYDSMKENRKLKKQLSELQKENDFLKNERLIIIEIKLKSKRLSESSIMHITEHPVIELFIFTFAVKVMI